MPTAVTDDLVAEVFPILAERARASERIASSFRPPQPGLLQEAGARRHQLIVGRRGVGKSMLLLNLVDNARAKHQLVVFLDMETYRGIPYPDVLIHILASLTDQLVAQLKGDQGPFRGRKLRRDLSRLRARLEKLLGEPHVTLETRVREQSRQSSGSAEVSSSLRTPPSGIGGAEVRAQIGSADGESSLTMSEATFVRTKMEGLQDAAPEYRRLLSKAVDALAGHSAVIVLDDFYFIPRDSQPNVLSYLHQISKGLEIWLKIGGVAHRLTPYAEGDPPIGLQPYHDAGLLRLDATLRDFVHTQTFLESILDDALGVVGVTLQDLTTEAARERLVLASGGVPRDYLSLAADALRAAAKRDDMPNRPRNRITAEDVNEAAPALLAQKDQELLTDASPDDVERLRAQYADLVRFCSQERKRNIFIVQATALREEQWGKDIAALSELRFLHSIGNLTVKSGSERYTGKRFEAFVLDLSAQVITRARGIEIIPFWTTEGLQRIRGAQFVYRPAADGERPTSDVSAAQEGDDWEQLEFESAVPDDEGGNVASSSGQ